MDVEKILSLSLSPLPVYWPSTNELVLWILQCLDEAKCGETIHKLEKESGPDFNMKCFEDLVTNGQWEEVETYLSGFTKLEDNGRSRKILYEIRKQKYLEALDRENEALLTYGDFKYARAILLKELKMLIETNPVFEGKLQFPSFQKSTLKTLYSQGLYSEACQHQVPDNPMPDYGTKTSFGPSIAPSSVINPSSAFMRWAHAPFRPSQPAPRGFMYPRPPPVPQQLFSAGPSHYTGFGAPTNAAFTLTHQRTVTDNPARGNEIVRLINLKSGDALLVVTQNANHKLWNWHSNDCNATVKATSGVSPQLTELMMLRSGVHVPSGADYQLPNSMQGGNGKVADIDTEGTFRPVRIVPIAEKFGMDDAAVLDNIIYAHEHQHNLLLGLAAKMAEEPFQLLIVDSTIALFRVDFAGRGELAERQQKLSQMLSSLIKIAEEFNAAVYITNEVISDPAGGVFVSDPKKPAGGHVLAHASTIRLMFRKGKSEQCIKSLPYNNKEIMRLMYSTSGDALLVLTHNANHKSGKWQSNDCNVSGKATSGVSPLLMMLASAVLVSSGADYQQVGCTGEASTSSSSSQGQQIVQPSILAEQAKIVMQILLNRSMEEEEVAVTNTLEQHVTHAHARSIPIIEVVVSGDERSYRQAAVGLVQLEERMDWFTLALQIYICARRRAGQAVEIPDLFGPQGLRTVSPYHCWPNSSVSYLAMDDSYLIWPRNSWANVVESLKAVYVRGAWRN